MKIVVGLMTLISVLLAGCGGGPDPTPPTAPVVKVGLFIDGAVSGLTYSTPSQSGVTTASGEFKYIEGETVTFKLMGLEIGKAVGAAYLTPTDIAPEKSLAAYSLNLMRVIQTLDTDSDASNGISLPSGGSIPNLNFNLSVAAFEVSPAVLALTTSLVKPLVTSKVALEHFGTSLTSIATTTTPTIDLTGKTISGFTFNDGCTNYLENPWVMQTQQTTVTLTGNENVINNPDGTCSLKTNTPPSNTATYANGKNYGLLSCGPICSPVELNQTFSGGTGSDAFTSNFRYDPIKKRLNIIKYFSNANQNRVVMGLYSLN